MEFRLNKIDTDLREKINAETREGKVHPKKEISISRDKGQHKEPNKEYKEKESDNKFSLSKYMNKGKKISIDAVKVEKVKVDAIGEEPMSKEEYRGLFLDARK